MSDENKKEKKSTNPNDKVIMVVNGEEIEMCAKTLYVCNARAQSLLRKLKMSSMETTHTMRFYWGDVIMLNIITNQMLQKIEPRVLARVMRPTKSISQDLADYREERKGTAERLRDTIIMANDKDLPLDYSRELEKYYKEANEDSSETTEEETAPVEEKNNIAEIENKNAEVPIASIEKEKTPERRKATKKEKNIPEPIFHETHHMYAEDSEEESVDFSGNHSSTEKKSTPQVPNKKEENKKKNTAKNKAQNTKTTPIDDVKSTDDNPSQNADSKVDKKAEELQKNKEAFTTYGEINLDALFN